MTLLLPLAMKARRAFQERAGRLLISEADAPLVCETSLTSAG